MRSLQSPRVALELLTRHSQCKQKGLVRNGVACAGAFDIRICPCMDISAPGGPVLLSCLYTGKMTSSTLQASVLALPSVYNNWSYSLAAHQVPL